MLCSGPNTIKNESVSHLNSFIESRLRRITAVRTCSRMSMARFQPRSPMCPANTQPLDHQGRQETQETCAHVMSCLSPGLDLHPVQALHVQWRRKSTNSLQMRVSWKVVELTAGCRSRPGLRHESSGRRQVRSIPGDQRKSAGELGMNAETIWTGVERHIDGLGWRW